MAAPPPARRRSVVVAIPALTFLAASVLTGCRTPGREKRACVDPNQRVLDQRECRSGGAGRYYYYRGSSYQSGQSVGGGSFTRGGSKAAQSASKVGRGGFGGKSSSGG